MSPLGLRQWHTQRGAHSPAKCCFPIPFQTPGPYILSIEVFTLPKSPTKSVIWQSDDKLELVAADSVFFLHGDVNSIAKDIIRQTKVLTWALASYVDHTLYKVSTTMHLTCLFVCFNYLICFRTNCTTNCLRFLFNLIFVHKMRMMSMIVKEPRFHFRGQYSNFFKS